MRKLKEKHKKSGFYSNNKKKRFIKLTEWNSEQIVIFTVVFKIELFVSFAYNLYSFDIATVTGFGNVKLKGKRRTH